MTVIKKDRNALIVQAKDSGKSYQEVANMFGLKAKSTVASIYHRTKNKSENRRS